MPFCYVGGHSGGRRRKFAKIGANFSKRKVPQTKQNQWFTELFGGDKRDRTADLLNAIQRKVVGIT